MTVPQRNGVKLFLLQILNYGIICFSYRVLAAGNVPWTVGTDLVYSFLSFTIIKKIADGGTSIWERTGYCLGSALGTYVGIIVSRLVIGK